MRRGLVWSTVSREFDAIATMKTEAQKFRAIFYGRRRIRRGGELLF